jgi:hypothetical protein
MGATLALKNCMHKLGNKPDVRLATVFYRQDLLQIIPVKRRLFYIHEKIYSKQYQQHKKTRSVAPNIAISYFTQ